MIDKKRGEELANQFRDQNPGISHLHFVVEDQPHKIYGEAGYTEALKDIKGAYHAQKGVVTLFTDNAKDEQDFTQTIRHEVLGHYALNTLKPQEKAALLQSISGSRNNPEMAKEWAQVDKHYPELSESQKAEEIYAFAAEKKYPPEIVPPSMRGGYSFDAKPINEQQLRILSKAISKGIERDERPQQTFPESDNAQFAKNRTYEKTEKRPLHEEVAEKLIKQIEAGTAPWQKPWKSMPSAPYNPTTGANYRGGNSLWLEMQGRSDPRWMTYKQAQDIGAQVRKGEKGTPIEYWKFKEEKIKTDSNGKKVLDENGKPVKVSYELKPPRVFTASVFNAEQIDGLPELKKPELTWNPNERAEKIIQGSGVPVIHEAGNKAFYRPSTDTITMPFKEQFPSVEKYTSTLMHELGHATGHESRLNRDLSGRFGSESYASEELRVDIGSYIVGREIGVQPDLERNAAYVKSWVKALKDDPREIFRASKDAEKIAETILSYEHQQTKPKESQAENETLETEKPAQDQISLKLAEKLAGQFSNDTDRQRFLNGIQEQISQQPNQNPNIKINERVATHERSEEAER